MKNNRLKNSLIAAGVAVLAGVLVFSVNAAIGDAPGYDPPGAGVSPVFTGLSVTGNAQIGGSTAIYGNFLGSGGTNRFDGDLEVDGTLEVLEDLELSSSYGISTGDAGPVNIDDDLIITGGIENDGYTCGISGCTYYDVIIDDALTVNNGIYTPQTGQFGTVDTAQIWYLAGSGGDPLTIADSLDVNGTTDINGDVFVSGNLKMDGGGKVGSFYDIYKSVSSASSTSTSCLSGDVLVACHGYTTSAYNLRYAYGWGNSCYVRYNATGAIGAILKCWDPAGTQTAAIYR